MTKAHRVGKGRIPINPKLFAPVLVQTRNLESCSVTNSIPRLNCTTLTKPVYDYIASRKSEFLFKLMFVGTVLYSLRTIQDLAPFVVVVPYMGLRSHSAAFYETAAQTEASS
eukprot:5647382-Amphidinium_carterae.1